MKEFQIAYIPIGVPTFHLESAGDRFAASCALLRRLDENTVCPEEMLLSIDLLRAFTDDGHAEVLRPFGDPEVNLPGGRDEVHPACVERHRNGRLRQHVRV